MVAVAPPSPAAAQVPSLPVAPDPATIPLQVGPFLIRPTVTIAAGGDANVFNDADPGRRQDLVLTATPRADLFVRAGRTWVTGSGAEDLSWYREYSSERAASGKYSIGWVAPLTRVTAAAAGQVSRLHERPGLEIDLRARRQDSGLIGAVEFSTGGGLFVGARGERRMVAFEQERFQDIRLDEALNRVEATGAVTARYTLTPLTTLTGEVAVREDRFDNSPVRNSRFRDARVGVRLDPFALIKGVAQLGYTAFTPTAADLPEFRGLTGYADLTYAPRESIRVGIRAIRAVEYSFTAAEPYYLLTGLAATVAQHIAGPLDVQLKIEGNRLNYRAAIPRERREETVHMVGGSIGYRVGRGSRLAVTLDRERRESPLSGRSYERWRYGVTLGVAY